MSAEPQKRYSIAEYLALERYAKVKSEYHQGEIFALAGASREHNLAVTAIVTALQPQLRRRGCETYSSDMRVRVSATDLFTYPDVVVVCGEPQFDDDLLDTLLNPLFLVEVLSPSTEDYDRGRKAAHYRTLPSLGAYLLVAQDRVHVELYSREPDGRWLLTETEDAHAVLDIPSIDCRLSLDEIYGAMPTGWGR